jgi:hypothetical protein
VTTIAGTGVRGTSGDGGLATAARLDEPFDVVPTASGALFILQSGATGPDAPRSPFGHDYDGRPPLNWLHRGAARAAEITPVEPDPGHAGEGR